MPRLGGAALTGDLLAHFYTSTVDALITLGDRQSVSNAEDRWLRFKEAGWLLFNIALPYLRGPTAVAGWLVQLVSSLDSDFKALREGDDTTRAQAVVDLLFNLSTVFMHGAGEVGMARATPIKVQPSMLQQTLPVRGELPVTGVLVPVQQPWARNCAVPVRCRRPWTSPGAACATKRRPSCVRSCARCRSCPARSRPA
ncbi:hypothetical protein NWF32_04345 [Pseudomonas qingdaonensis]|nr:hypothetical protein [Pseudomonas qingdaonensis]